MKNIYWVVTCLIALPLAAYQTGPSNRANFEAAAQTQPAAEPVPQEGYRSFSNYNNRFGQGVKTSGVQTSVAGSSVTDLAAQRPKVGKKAAAALAPAKGGKPAAGTAPSAPAAAAMPAGGDPAAMLQQVQGMMQNMQAMQGAAAAGQAPAAMPAMPDMSALMNSVANPAGTSTTPAKK